MPSSLDNPLDFKPLESLQAEFDLKPAQRLWKRQ